MGAFYLTCLLFVGGILGAICRLIGIRISALIGYLREELLLVLGTSSSESALPGLMAKLEAAGCEKSIVGLVGPAGYSFNLDGTSIYLTMAAVFVAQALQIQLTWTQELTLLGVLLISSKGAAGVTGSGFITLAATLATVPSIPVGGLALILGIDRFMSEARALTNLIGNAVATLVVARWENSIDEPRLHAVLAGRKPIVETRSSSFRRGGDRLKPLDVLATLTKTFQKATFPKSPDHLLGTRRTQDLQDRPLLDVAQGDRALLIQAARNHGSVDQDPEVG